MSKDLFVPRSMLLLACFGMILPQTVLADAPIATLRREETTMDVALLKDGVLLGQVMNRQGQPREGSVVSIRQHGRQLIRIRTDDLGRFAVKGLRGGTYELLTAGTSRQIRAWSKDAAPPAASQIALLVDGVIVRGQNAMLSSGRNGGLGILGVRPWVWAGIAAVFAIPLALDDDDTHLYVTPSLDVALAS